MSVSVIICTYNGAARLPETLRHLAAQRVTAPLRWEVLVIDNNSGDDTLQVVGQLQQQFPDLPLRAVRESSPGKINALNRGFREAAFEYVIICDDDCWLHDQYVQSAYSLMELAPGVGIANGYYENRYETPPPRWFVEYEKTFSCTSHGKERKDITESPGSIWGAGMVVRKSAYEQLMALGFEPLLTGGIGNKRSAGEDTELCLAVRLLGYRIVYDPALHFVHFMPARRFEWQTLVNITRANGEASIYYNPYRYHFFRKLGKTYPVHARWTRELMANLTFLLNLRSWLNFLLNNKPGNPAVVRIERQLAKVKALLRDREKYDHSFSRIAKLLQVAGPAPAEEVSPGDAMASTVSGAIKESGRRGLKR